MDYNVSIVQKNLTVKQIHKYFIENRELFIHTLFKKVDIEKYSEKIGRSAVHFCAFYREELAGFLACYFNHPLKEYGYITTISTPEKFQKQGIGKRLMHEIKKYAETNGFKKIKLEVDKKNLIAVNFYINLGYEIIGISNGDLLLELVI